jgi:hypothetical protein
MEELQQYDIIEITDKNSVRIIGSFHSMIDGEIVLFVPPSIQYILKTDVVHITRIKRKDEIDTSQIESYFKYSSLIHKRQYKLQDELIITFEDSDEPIEATVTEIVHDCLTLQLKDDSYVYINFNYKSVPLGIIEIKRKQTHDLDETTEEKSYTVVSYNIDETKCKYTLNIQIDAMLQYLNFNKTYNGEQFAQRYKELMLTFPYGTSLLPNQTNLKWIYPTTSASVTLLSTTKNMIFKKSLVNSLMCYEKSILTNKDKPYSTIQEIYKSILRVFEKKHIFTPEYNTYMLPISVILKFIATTASKEQEFNWAKKIQHWITYVTDEFLPIDGYVILPESSITYSKLYLPETSLMERIQLNSISQYHLFNIQCESSIKLKQVDDYTHSIPTLEKLIHSVPIYYSFHEFVKHLEPYHIYANHIPYSLYPSIHKQITKNIHSFLINKKENTPVYSDIFKNNMYEKKYISSSELYSYALSLDSANAYLLSSLTNQYHNVKIDNPTQVQKEFIMKPSEPTCELKNDCDTEGVTKLKNFNLSLYHSSTVDNKNSIDFPFLHKKLKYKTKQLLKYNNKLISLFSSTEKTDRIPYSYELFYQIMAYPLTQRYTSLLVFLNKYTTLDVVSNMFVCSTSNIPLVPMLFKILADAYLNNIDEYNTILYKYCKSSPQIYIEDGYYKDKHTGISLAPIERVHSYDELIRSDEIEVEQEDKSIEYSLPQKYVENHIYIIWKAVTLTQIVPKIKMIDFINDMISEFTITEKVTSIKAKYLLSLLIFVYIKNNIPCDKIVEDIGKNKSITEIDLGLENKPFSFLSNVQKYSANITQLCSVLYSKYKFVSKHDVPVKLNWGNFMPYFDSNHPILHRIKLQVQKSIPIHSTNGELNKINHAFVEFDIPKQKHHTTSFSAFIQKIEGIRIPPLDLHIEIENPTIFELGGQPSFNQKYTSEFTSILQKRLSVLQSTTPDLSNEIINGIIDKYPAIYMSNYIKHILQFYAVCNDSSELKDAIPITHRPIMAPSHLASITRVLNNYYENMVSHEKWGNLFEQKDSQTILKELNQPLTEDEKIILKYYLYQISSNVSKDVIPFINTKLQSEINIPDYDDIKKRMSLRQSVERKNFVTARSNLSSTEKMLTGIIETDITKTSYNITQYLSREEDALKSDIDLGNDGNE